MSTSQLVSEQTPTVDPTAVKSQVIKGAPLSLLGLVGLVKKAKGIPATLVGENEAVAEDPDGDSGVIGMNALSPRLPDARRRSDRSAALSRLQRAVGAVSMFKKSNTAANSDVTNTAEEIPTPDTQCTNDGTEGGITTTTTVREYGNGVQHSSSTVTTTTTTTVNAEDQTALAVDVLDPSRGKGRSHFTRRSTQSKVYTAASCNSVSSAPQDNDGAVSEEAVEEVITSDDNGITTTTTKRRVVHRSQGHSNANDSSHPLQVPTIPTGANSRNPRSSISRTHTNAEQEEDEQSMVSYEVGSITDTRHIRRVQGTSTHTSSTTSTAKSTIEECHTSTSKQSHSDWTTDEGESSANEGGWEVDAATSIKSRYRKVASSGTTTITTSSHSTSGRKTGATNSEVVQQNMMTDEQSAGQIFTFLATSGTDVPPNERTTTIESNDIESVNSVDLSFSSSSSSPRSVSSRTTHSSRRRMNNNSDVIQVPPSSFSPTAGTTGASSNTTATTLFTLPSLQSSGPYDASETSTSSIATLSKKKTSFVSVESSSTAMSFSSDADENKKSVCKMVIVSSATSPVASNAMQNFARRLRSARRTGAAQSSTTISSEVEKGETLNETVLVDTAEGGVIGIVIDAPQSRPMQKRRSQTKLTDVVTAAMRTLKAVAPVPEIASASQLEAPPVTKQRTKREITDTEVVSDESGGEGVLAVHTASPMASRVRRLMRSRKDVNSINTTTIESGMSQAAESSEQSSSETTTIVKNIVNCSHIASQETRETESTERDVGTIIIVQKDSSHTIAPRVPSPPFAKSTTFHTDDATNALDAVEHTAPQKNTTTRMVSVKEVITDAVVSLVSGVTNMTTSATASAHHEVHDTSLAVTDVTTLHLHQKEMSNLRQQEEPPTEIPTAASERKISMAVFAPLTTTSLPPPPPPASKAAVEFSTQTDPVEMMSAAEVAGFRHNHYQLNFAQNHDTTLQQTEKGIDNDTQKTIVVNQHLEQYVFPMPTFTAAWSPQSQQQQVQYQQQYSSPNTESSSPTRTIRNGSFNATNNSSMYSKEESNSSYQTSSSRLSRVVTIDTTSNSTMSALPSIHRRSLTMSQSASSPLGPRSHADLSNSSSSSGGSLPVLVRRRSMRNSVDFSSLPAIPQPSTGPFLGSSPRGMRTMLIIDRVQGVPLLSTATRVFVYVGNDVDSAAVVHPTASPKFYKKPTEHRAQTLDSSIAYPEFFIELDITLQAKGSVVVVVVESLVKGERTTFGHSLIRLDSTVRAGNYKSRVFVGDPRQSQYQQISGFRGQKQDAVLDASNTKTRDALHRVVNKEPHQFAYQPCGYVEWRCDSWDQTQTYYGVPLEPPLTEYERVFLREREGWRDFRRTPASIGYRDADHIFQTFEKTAVSYKTDELSASIVPYNRSRGMFVNIECIRGIAKQNAVFKVIATVRTGKRWTHGMTEHHDWDSDLGVQHFLDEPFVYNEMDYDSTQEILFQVFRLEAPSLDNPLSPAAAQSERALGIYRAMVCRNGWWTELVMDDLIPAAGGKYHGARSRDPCELWIPMLEKAIAKAYGKGYVGLHNITALDVIDTITGCPHTTFSNEWRAAQAAHGLDPEEAFSPMKKRAGTELLEHDFFSEFPLGKSAGILGIPMRSYLLPLNRNNTFVDVDMLEEAMNHQLSTFVRRTA